jgi:hypothetical protein
MAGYTDKDGYVHQHLPNVAAKKPAPETAYCDRCRKIGKVPQCVECALIRCGASKTAAK